MVSADNFFLSFIFVMVIMMAVVAVWFLGYFNSADLGARGETAVASPVPQQEQPLETDNPVLAQRPDLGFVSYPVAVVDTAAPNVFEQLESNEPVEGEDVTIQEYCASRGLLYVEQSVAPCLF